MVKTSQEIRAEEYLNIQQQNASDEYVTTWSKIQDLYNRRLYHQLTEELISFIKKPFFDEDEALIKLYNEFIVEFEHRINKVSHMEIVARVVDQYKNPTEAETFLQKTKEKLKGNTEAVILCNTTIALLKLKLAHMVKMSMTDDESKLQKIIKEVESVIADTRVLVDSYDGVSSVHGRFYDLCSNYHLQLGNYADYYKDALRYLGCTKLKDIPLEGPNSQAERAKNLCLAGLLGDGIYNFGELLQHDILQSLHHTEYNYLVDLVSAFNSGDVVKFKDLEPVWMKQLDLAQNAMQLHKKIRLLCLMEMAFKRPSNNRKLSFSEIAEVTQISENEVELLIMKCLALNLLRGFIDQVDSTFHFSWVQPRVLNKDQILVMQEKLNVWCNDVQSIEQLVQKEAGDMIEK